MQMYEVKCLYQDNKKLGFQFRVRQRTTAEWRLDSQSRTRYAFIIAYDSIPLTDTNNRLLPPGPTRAPDTSACPAFSVWTWMSATSLTRRPLGWTPRPEAYAFLGSTAKEKRLNFTAFISHKIVTAVLTHKQERKVLMSKEITPRACAYKWGNTMQ